MKKTESHLTVGDYLASIGSLQLEWATSRMFPTRVFVRAIFLSDSYFFLLIGFTV